MRRKLVLGVGLVALAGGSALGQFAIDRVPQAGAPQPAPAVPGGLTPTPSPATPAGGGAARPAPPPASGSLYTPLYSTPAEASRPPASGTPLYGTQPPAAPAAPAGGVAPTVPALSALPTSVEIPTALPKDHPWRLKPEDGAFFIIVKSYVRPAEGSKAARNEGEKWASALAYAETLAKDIRDTHRVQAFLYEYISEERKAEMRAEIVARRKAEADYLTQVRALEQRAQLQGFDFARPELKFRTWKHDYPDQIGVLVGGFQTQDDALKALAVLKKWDKPRNEQLLDRGTFFTRTGEGKAAKETAEWAYVNPYETAFVVPNPAVAKGPQAAQPAVDPYIVRLNDGRPYNLLKAAKGWTLGVKSFSVPVELVGKDAGMSLARKPAPSKTAELLVATAEQAEALAGALRGMKGDKGQPLGLEAFVLHTQTRSLVTVGQFDSPDDPALHATRRLLLGMQAKVTKDETGLQPVGNAPTLFDAVAPIPIPKP